MYVTILWKKFRIIVYLYSQDGGTAFQDKSFRLLRGHYENIRHFNYFNCILRAQVLGCNKMLYEVFSALLWNCQKSWILLPFVWGALYWKITKWNWDTRNTAQFTEVNLAFSFVSRKFKNLSSQSFKKEIEKTPWKAKEKKKRENIRLEKTADIVRIPVTFRVVMYKVTRELSVKRGNAQEKRYLVSCFFISIWVDHSSL